MPKNGSQNDHHEYLPYIERKIANRLLGNCDLTFEPLVAKMMAQIRRMPLQLPSSSCQMGTGPQASCDPPECSLEFGNHSEQTLDGPGTARFALAPGYHMTHLRCSLACDF